MHSTLLKNRIMHDPIGICESIAKTTSCSHYSAPLSFIQYNIYGSNSQYIPNVSCRLYCMMIVTYVPFSTFSKHFTLPANFNGSATMSESCMLISWHNIIAHKYMDAHII